MPWVRDCAVADLGAARTAGHIGEDRGMRRDRTQSDRDAATVEMVYAAMTGAGLAALGFLALATPVMLGQAHGDARKGWFTAAVIVAAALFCGRVALTLRRFERRNRPAEQEQTPGG